MNWTGGALPRSRNGHAKATLSNVQKKHFAKVRGKLLGPPPSSPDFDTSIFKDARSQRLHHHNRRPRSPCRDHQSQTRLDSYDDIAPVVRKLGSLRPRKNHAQQDSGAGNERPQLNAQDQSVHQSRSYHRNPTKAITINKVEHQDSFTVQKEAVSCSLDSFEAKRQQLLSKRDWVGFASTKPVEIHFPSARARERIGKRRRLNTAEQRMSLNQDQQQRRTSYQTMEDRRPPRRYGQPSSSIGDISIRIGEQEHEKIGNAEGAVSATRQIHYVGTPDEMLLDLEHHSTSSVHSQRLKPTVNRRNDPTESSSVSTRRTQVQDRATPASLSNSWAGFSPWTDDDDMRITLKQEPEADVQAGNLQISLQAAAPLKREKEQLDQHWASVPGLPLIFSDSTREPIEISSDSDSCFESMYSSSIQEKPCLALHTDEQRQLHGAAYHSTSDSGRGLADLNDIEMGTRKIPDVEAVLNSPARDQLMKPRETPQKDESIHLGEKDVSTPVTPHISEPSKPGTITVPTPQRDVEKPTISTFAGLAASPISVLMPDVSLLPRPPTPSGADEELIWRRFVFGSDDAEQNWEIEDRETTDPKKKRALTDISSPTVATTNLDHSSLLAEASSSNPAPTATYRSSSPDQLSILAQPSMTQTSHRGATTSSSHPASSSLPSNPLRNPSQSRSPSKSSLQVQPSLSTSPARTQNTLSALSSDELAATPARPTFVFRKPTRYVGSEGESQERIFLGSGGKRKGRKGKGRASDVKIWEDGEDGELLERREEDEIEDEDEDLA